MCNYILMLPLVRLGSLSTKVKTWDLSAGDFYTEGVDIDPRFSEKIGHI